MKIGKIAVVLAAVFAVALGTAQAGYVTIGDTDNTADSSTGYGAVDYTYQISETEVTIAEFTTSGAGDGDENYWNDGDRNVGTAAPAVKVSLYEAKKYANYLTEQANGGLSDYNLYSSDGTGAGSYTRADAISDGITVYGVPTEDEWYKAAYGNKNDDGDFSVYSDYADGTDTAPNKSTDGSTGWNYDSAIGNPWTVDNGTAEQNDTYNMMGNVWEWQEDAGGVLRGGRFASSADYLRSSHRGATGDPTSEYSGFGFRVVAIPEPVSGGLFVLAVGLWWVVRRIARA